MSSSKLPAGVLLLHGLTGNPTEVKSVARELEARGYAVETPTLPGHGGGHDELLATTADDWRRGVRELYASAAQRWDKVYVVGLCASSVLAALLAAEEPGVAGLVLLSTHYGKFHHSMSSRKYLLPLGYTFPRWLRKHFYWTEKAPYGIKDPRMQELITSAIAAAKGRRETKDHGSFRTYLETLFQMDRLVKDLKRCAARVSSPVLFIHSIEDTWFTVQNSIDLCNDISSADKTVLVINNCNHVLTVDLRKRDVAEYVASFFDRLQKKLPASTSSPCA